MIGGERPLLEVQDLVTSFDVGKTRIRAVDGVSISVGERTTVGVVGESGCGKSVTALSILRLIPTPPGRIESGSIQFEGDEILDRTEKEMRSVRGEKIAMIFQEPMTSLNPVYTVGDQIVETLRLKRPGDESQTPGSGRPHRTRQPRLGRKAARARAIELLHAVGIAGAEHRVDDYPHQLSGGMRQRVMIAMAIACNPQLLIADEPTTALDVTVQAQILDLLDRLQSEFGMSVLLITHDFGIVAEFVRFVYVMYAGKVVESAPTATLLEEPLHPYTRALLASRRALESFHSTSTRAPLPVIPGVVPDLRQLPKGCRFQDRCPDVIDICRQEEPPLLQVTYSPQHSVACHRARV